MQETDAAPGPRIEYRRFDIYNRLLRGACSASWAGLYRMPCCSTTPLGGRLAAVFGGGRSAGIVHRVFAVVMMPASSSTSSG
jgi:hypothetical protein